MPTPIDNAEVLRQFHKEVSKFDAKFNEKKSSREAYSAQPDMQTKSNFDMVAFQLEGAMAVVSE